MPYLSNPSNILFTIFGREAEIFVQSKPNVVTIQSIGLQAQFQQMLLKGCCDCGFARRREAGEPDCAASLLSKLAALFAREACVPCDVAGIAINESSTKSAGFDI